VVHSPVRGDFPSGSFMTTKLPCYRRDASKRW
jgi:hypothetical protein